MSLERADEREWGQGPEGAKDVVAYVNETPELHALLFELHLLGYLETEQDDGSEQWDQIFTIANHWREHELSLRAVPPTASGPTPQVDAFLRAENCSRDNPVAFDWLVGFARALERRCQAAERLHTELCEQWNEECETACDSYGHAENCKAVNLAAAKRALNERCQALEQALQKCLAALTDPAGMNEEIVRDKAKFRAFMDDCDKHVDEAISAARAALTRKDAK